MIVSAVRNNNFHNVNHRPGPRRLRRIVRTPFRWPVTASPTRFE
ncbi:hypothetical protein BN903_228 [Halorubrum sp. AJ67]|nr:hypothetical protein BN903_228 [Halorubrum sp. AJ67]